MLFAAKVVEKGVIGLTIITVGVITFIFIIPTMIIPSLEYLTPFFLAALILFVIVAAVVFKGDVSSYKLENDLYIFDSEIQICHIVFPMDEVQELKFSFRSFYGMIFPGYDTEPDPAYSRSYGLDNRISFKYKNQHFNYKFYIHSQQHFFQFRDMLEQLYIQQVVFEENNYQGKTFMMHNVNDAELRILQRKYQRY